MSIRISNGLKASYKNFEVYDTDQTIHRLKTRTDCYEIVNDINRVYADIDGKLNVNISEDDFNKIDNETRDELERLLGQQKYCLMTSSNFSFHKISWRFVILDKAVSKKHNKHIIKELNKEAKFPDGIAFDEGVYGINRKMRMVNSNKDNENRPLKLVKGELIDTLISYIPDDVIPEEDPVEEKKSRGRPKKIVENPLITEILNSIDVKRHQDYNSWITIGIICFNLELSVEVWDNASKRASNYKEGECEKKWKTFTKGSSNLTKLWEWLKEDNIEIYNELKQDDYHYLKEQFEKTHFKLMNPARFVRIEENDILVLLDDHALSHNYLNKYCAGESFISLWKKDPTIRTYKQFVFMPKQEPPVDCYNLFTGFAIEPVEGDWSAVQELVWNLSGRNQDIYDYIIKWSAHLVQKPYEKPSMMIIFSSAKEGVGKDTYGDQVLGKIIGHKHYFSTTDHENEIFGRFTGHLQDKLFVKLEEMNSDVCKKNDDKLKGWITCEKKSFEEKGISKCPPIDSFVRFMGTTNDACPVKLTTTFRRYVLINPYQETAGDIKYWESMYSRLNTETLQAFHNHLLTLDISNWNPRSKVDTDAVNDARVSQAPPHSVYFQQLVQFNDDMNETFEASFTTIKNGVNKLAKFEYSDFKLVKEIKEFPHTKRILHGRTQYEFNFKELKDYLKQKHWWLDGM
jgi:hypothetical protein